MQSVKLNLSKTPFTMKLEAGAHAWLADEPAALGGLDLGPTPFELFIGSIAACAAITAQMYARRKGWPLDGISVQADHRKIDASDCPDCHSDSGQVSEVSLRFTLQGNLTEEQRLRLLEIAGKCPVKKAIEGEVVFRSLLG